MERVAGNVADTVQAADVIDRGGPNEAEGRGGCAGPGGQRRHAFPGAQRAVGAVGAEAGADDLVGPDQRQIAVRAEIDLRVQGRQVARREAEGDHPEQPAVLRGHAPRDMDAGQAGKPPTDRLADVGPRRVWLQLDAEIPAVAQIHRPAMRRHGGGQQFAVGGKDHRRLHRVRGRGGGEQRIVVRPGVDVEAAVGPHPGGDDVHGVADRVELAGHLLLEGRAQVVGLSAGVVDGGVAFGLDQPDDAQPQQDDDARADGENDGNLPSRPPPHRVGPWHRVRVSFARHVRTRIGGGVIHREALLCCRSARPGTMEPPLAEVRTREGPTTQSAPAPSRLRARRDGDRPRCGLRRWRHVPTRSSQTGRARGPASNARGIPAFRSRSEIPDRLEFIR